MRTSGRRQRLLAEDNGRLIAENGRLLQELRKVTAERDDRDNVIFHLSLKTAPIGYRPAGGGYVPASLLRASQTAQNMLADRLELLQQANMTLVCRSCTQPLTAVSA